MYNLTPNSGKKTDKDRTGIVAGNPMADQLIGFELSDRFQILRLIGSGGWGNVYLGKHLSLGIDVAIKVIHKHLSQNEASLKRLEQEAKLLSRLQSPYIVRIIDYGLEPFPYIVMEYFDGTPLSDWLKDNGPMEYAYAIELFGQMCDGLSTAGDLGLVHRDLKPGNVLVKIEDRKLHSKILDFGIAKLIDEGGGGEKLTTTGEILGSPPYMSPEQWAGRTDHRSDLYSLGCIMYEVLTGQQAFTAQYGMDYLNKHVSVYPQRMQEIRKDARFPAVFDDIVRKCLQKAPDNRYPTSAALKADLEHLKAGRKLKIRLPEEKKLFSKRNILIAATLLLLTCLGTWFMRETIIGAWCQNINARADKDKAAGKTAEAVAGYRQTIMLSRLLPRQAKQKLHAMKMLAATLKERKEWQESAALDNEINELVGSKAWPAFQKLRQRIAYERERLANFGEAELLSRQLISEAASHSGTHSLAYSEALDALGATLRQAGKLQEALNYQMQALNISRDLMEPDDPDLAEKLNNLGQVYGSLKRFDDSEKMYRQAMSINEKAGRMKDVSTNYNNIATNYVYQKEYNKAIDAFDKSLELCRKYNGANGVNVLSNKARLYFLTKEYDKAIKYFNEALDLREKEGTANVPEAEMQWTDLGRAYIALKDLKNAERCFEKSLELRKNGVQGARSVTVIRNLSNIKDKLGKEDEAKELRSRLAKILGLQPQIVMPGKMPAKAHTPGRQSDTSNGHN